MCCAAAIATPASADDRADSGMNRLPCGDLQKCDNQPKPKAAERTHPVAVYRLGGRAAPAGDLPCPPKFVVLHGISYSRRVVWSTSRPFGRSIPKEIGPPMNRTTITLVAAKVALGSALALGFATMPHAMAHEPGWHDRLRRRCRR